MSHHIWTFLVLALLIKLLAAAPVDPKKNTVEKKTDESKEKEVDDLGLEYGRYLQQVVETLEQDKEFAKKLQNISVEEIQSGKIADHLEFVKHNVRTKLDELKRMEVDRLRKLVQEQMERTELGLYRDEDGRLLPSPDGRRWRTIPGHQGGQEGGVGGGGGDFWLGLDRRGVKIPQHLDVDNLHTFEVGDLKKLIKTATRDLEALDKKRREEFKHYEMEKEMAYRDTLKNMTEDKKKDTQKHHEEMIEKHKDHPKVHHPGSKPQLEQVWEEEDHLPKNEFDPRTFFAMHDMNADGHLDEKEIEALLMPEVRKMYDPKNEEDDPAEMEEEYHRMREHIFNETDKNKDGLISLEEFMKMTQEQEFEQDEGWKGLDEQTVYSEAELEEYMRQRQMAMHQQYYGDGDPRMYYDVPHAQNQGMPPHVNYQASQPGMHAQQPQYHQPAYISPDHPQQHQAVPPQQLHGAAQQQYQGVPPQQQYQGVPPQQQYQAVPPQQQQGVQQHMQGGSPQHMQGVPPQHMQGVPPQHMQGVPPQHMQGVPPQHMQGVPPQHMQGVPPQHQGVPPQQQFVQPGNQPQYHQAVPPSQQYVAAPADQPHLAQRGDALNEIPSAGSPVKQNVPNVPSPSNQQQPPRV